MPQIQYNVNCSISMPMPQITRGKLNVNISIIPCSASLTWDEFLGNKFAMVSHPVIYFARQPAILPFVKLLQKQMELLIALLIVIVQGWLLTQTCETILAGLCAVSGDNSHQFNLYFAEVHWTSTYLFVYNSGDIMYSKESLCQN